MHKSLVWKCSVFGEMSWHKSGMTKNALLMGTTLYQIWVGAWTIIIIYIGK